MEKRINSIEYFLNEHVTSERKVHILNFHESHVHLINGAAGSSHNHQAWAGGYRDHITQCLNLALTQYDTILYLCPAIKHESYEFPSFESVVVILYFHDIEKIFKYNHPPVKIDKKAYYNYTLPDEYQISLQKRNI